MVRMREDRRLALRRRVFNEIAIDGNAAEPACTRTKGRPTSIIIPSLSIQGRSFPPLQGPSEILSFTIPRVGPSRPPQPQAPLPTESAPASPQHLVPRPRLDATILGWNTSSRERSRFRIDFPNCGMLRGISAKSIGSAPGSAIAQPNLTITYPPAKSAAALTASRTSSFWQLPRYPTIWSKADVFCCW